MKIRISPWASGAITFVNIQQQSINTTPGSYATITHTWKSGDIVTVKLLMQLKLIAANNNKNLAAGNYDSSAPSGIPTLMLSSLKRTSGSNLDVTGTAGRATVTLSPFYDAQGYRYVVYLSVLGSLPASAESS
ncbi:hypothetical protein GGR51DRAFT_577155 [Nemania sp. FL0031]|nr:hypothetical protein GGR51DRAFT_577155 [Nemania sp. FL0031]